MYLHQWLTSCGVWLTNANILPMIVTLVVWASLNLCILRLCCGLKAVPFCIHLQNVCKDAWLTVNFTGIITGILPSTLFPVVWFCLLKQRQSLYWWRFYHNIISLFFFFFLIERRCSRGRGDQWRYKLISLYLTCEVFFMFPLVLIENTTLMIPQLSVSLTNQFVSCRVW